MRRILPLLPLLLLSVMLPAVLAEDAKPQPQTQPKPKPKFQFESGDIRISIPSADEPRVAQFGPESIRTAARYLDQGAVAWLRTRSCLACHTPGAYMLDRPMLSRQLGKPNDEVRDEFVKALDEKLPAPKEENGLTFYPRSYYAVWRAAGLVQWDKYVTGKLSEPAERSLRDMFAHQSSDGGFHATGEVEIPYITTDFELTLHAARAVVDAPGWLAGLKDSDLLARVERMKTFLRDSKPRNDYERILHLELAALMPNLVTAPDKDAAIALLWSKQKPDGGWSTRDMSATRNWRTPVSDKVATLIDGLPDAANPASDPYMTALAIILLRENGVPAADARIAQGVKWLKGEQRASGRWWMHSLYRGNYHFTIYISTTKALRALSLCGELPDATAAAR